MPLKTSSDARVAARTSFAGFDRAQFEPVVHLNVARDVDTAQVMIVFVSARGHVVAVFQRGIRDDASIAGALVFAPTPPRLPALAPSNSRISSGCAGRTAIARRLSASLVSCS